MKFTLFPGANDVMSAPPGTEDSVGALPIFRGIDKSSRWPVMISAFTFDSLEERMEFLRNGRFYLTIYGSDHPVVSVSAYNYAQSEYMAPHPFPAQPNHLALQQEAVSLPPIDSYDPESGWQQVFRPLRIENDVELPMTWGDLKRFCDSLSQDQLTRRVWINEDQDESPLQAAFAITVSTDDMINPTGDALEPRSTYGKSSDPLDQEVYRDEPVVLEKGAIILEITRREIRTEAKQ